MKGCWPLKGGLKKNSKGVTDSLCTTAANPGKDSVFPQHRPLPVGPEDISTTTFTTRCQLLDSRWWGWRTDGRTCWAALSDSTANSTDRLFRDWRRVPQVLCEEAKEGRDEASEPSVLKKNSVITGAGWNIVVSELPNSFQGNNHEETQQHRGFGDLLTFVFSRSPKALETGDGLQRYIHNNEIPELFAKHEEISCILLRALRHFLGSVPKLLEAVVNISNQLSACWELSLDVGGEIFLHNRDNTALKKHLVKWLYFGLFLPVVHVTNLCQGCDSVGHELIPRFLVSVTQLSLDILCGKRGEVCVSGKRHWVAGTGSISLSVIVTIMLIVQQPQSEAAASHESTTYRAAEGEEGLDQLVLWEEGMSRHQVDESAEGASPALDELALRDVGQDCGRTPERQKPLDGIRDVIRGETNRWKLHE